MLCAEKHQPQLLGRVVEGIMDGEERLEEAELNLVTPPTPPHLKSDRNLWGKSCISSTAGKNKFHPKTHISSTSHCPLPFKVPSRGAGTVAGTQGRLRMGRQGGVSAVRGVLEERGG